jgi:hypothetical protein
VRQKMKYINWKGKLKWREVVGMNLRTMRRRKIRRLLMGCRCWKRCNDEDYFRKKEMDNEANKNK